VFSAPRSRPMQPAVAAALLILTSATAMQAQQAPASLTLEQAIELARRNNPEFLSQVNDEAESEWAVREAYGALVPAASVSGTLQYQAPGSQRIGIYTADDIGVGGIRTGYLVSGYSLGMTYRLGAETLLRPGQEKANRRAVRARIEAAEFDLATVVTRQYLAVLRAQDGVDLARQELQRAEENYKLAEARVSVGAAIALEAKQAEVERGRAEVELLKAENLRRAELLRLIEQLGIEFDRDISLTSSFPIFEPRWTVEELVARAIDRHPQLRALRAAEDAQNAAVRMARSQYLPTLDLSLGWSGFAREMTNDDVLLQQARSEMEGRRESCIAANEILSRLNPPLPAQDCSGFVLTPDQESRLLARNNVFPFDFTKEPFSAQLRISLPLFNGFSRERRIEAARVAADDARLSLRREELRLRTEVATAYQNLETAYRAATLEERNRDLAGEQLNLARERYSVGAVSFVDLLEAETLKARADRAYLNSIYAFHESLAALESAIGQKLEIPQESR